jgi:hypothetical protein
VGGIALSLSLSTASDSNVSREPCGCHPNQIPFSNGTLTGLTLAAALPAGYVNVWFLSRSGQSRFRFITVDKIGLLFYSVIYCFFRGIDTRSEPVQTRLRALFLEEAHNRVSVQGCSSVLVLNTRPYESDYPNRVINPFSLGPHGDLSPFVISRMMRADPDNAFYNFATTHSPLASVGCPPDFISEYFNGPCIVRTS